MQVRLLAAAAALIVGLSPVAASAASFSFSPSAGSYAVGKSFTLKVQLDPKGEQVNASDGTLSFDPAILSVSGVSKEGSVFSLWTADPKFSNADGTVEWSGGTPSAFSNAGTIVAITFKAKKAGTATITATKGSVLAADGKGTDVYAAGDSATITITEAAPEPPPAPEPETAETDAPLAGDVTGSLPIAPQITSSTHGKSEQWYATSTIELAWKPTADVTAVRTGFSQSADETPTTTQKLASTTASFAGVADGTWYFHAQYKNDAGWGPVTHFAINIDTVPPEDFDIALVSGDVPKLSFKATDALSGVERYEVLFGTTTVGSVKEKDFGDGLFVIPPTPGGEIAVTVKAADKAGNHRDVTRTLSIPSVAKPTDEAAPKQSSNLLEHIALVLFALATGGISAWYWRANKQQEVERARLLNRVVEVREKNDRVFSAMREEFEQMVQDFDEKPQLTPQERDLLEGIKEVLDISEGLLDSALEELKREVRGK